MEPLNTWVRTLAAGLAIGLAAAAGQVTGIGERTESIVYDLCHRLAPCPSPSEDIVIVAVDDESLSRLGRWPWPRSYHSRLLEILSGEGARAVGLDIIMSDPSDDPAADRALADASRASGRTVLPCYSDSKVLPRGSRVFHAAGRTSRPYPELAASSVIGTTVAVPDSDGVLRRHLPVMVDDGRLLFSMDLELARLYLDLAPSEVTLARGGIDMGPVHVPLDRTGRVLIKYSSDMPGAPRYRQIPYHDVLDGRFDRGEFLGKIVLVGVSARGLHDFYFTPLSSAGNPSPGVEIHASAVQAILGGHMVRRIERPISVLLTVGAGVVLSAAFRGLPAGLAAGASFACAACVLLVSLLLFGAANLWLNPVPVLAVAALVLVRHLGVSFAVADREKARVRGALGRYLSPAVVDEVLRTRRGLSLGGRRLDVTVMFADIRGFTSFAERETPERVVDVLNAHLAVIAGAVFNEAGMLDKFTGDGVMAVFGAPVPQTDHAFRAARAAMAIRDEFRKRAAQAAETVGAARGPEAANGAGTWLQVGIGIASGEVVVGNIGTIARMDYTAVGDAANLAARLEGMAEPGQILVCARTFETIRDRLALERVDSVSVRGRSSAVDIYELL